MEAKQKSLLYLIYVVMHTDGVIHSQEDRVLKKIFDFEKISEAVLIIFKKNIKKKSLKELHKIGMDGLRNSSRKDQIKTLAWIHKMIYADNDVNVKEAKFLLDTIKPTDIAYSELKKVVEELPEL